MPEIHWIDGYPTSFVGGRFGPPDGKVEEIVVHKGKAKAVVAAHAAAVHNRARGLLEARREHDNAVNRARIVWEKPEDHGGKTDHKIHLAVDISIQPLEGENKYAYEARGVTAAIMAARAIEYGHEGKGYGPAPFQILGRNYPGKWILHDAGGLSHSGKGR